VAQIKSLMEWVRAEVPEFRRAEALGYPVAGLTCLTVMAMAQGVARGPQDLALYADTLSQHQLRALHFRLDADHHVRCPQKTTFTRFLHGVDGDTLERVLLRWQDQFLGPTQDRLVMVDGKKVRHGGVEIVNTVDGAGWLLGSVVTPDNTNEIPAARQLLRPLNLIGKTTIGDALHTPTETAQQILYEQGGDYLLTVKGNPKALQDNLQRLFAKQAFSPSADGADLCGQTGAQPRPLGDSSAAMPRSDPSASGLSGGPAGGPLGNPRAPQGSVVPRRDAHPEQSHPGGTPSPRYAGAQTGLLGGGKSTASLLGYHAARG
jgi:hypothetical protein